MRPGKYLALLFGLLVFLRAGAVRADVSRWVQLEQDALDRLFD